MPYRVADITTARTMVSRVNSQRARLSTYQEQLASGKRINRPSDDPSGAEAVIRIRTSQEEIGQFQRSAIAANQKLTAADDTLSGYENLLERARTLVTQGLSDTGTQSSRNALATELQSLRGRMLNVANTRYGDEYLFGGTIQSNPPFNPTTGTLVSATALPQYVQVEPGANAIQTSVTAMWVFADPSSDIFADLDSAIGALRGTGDAVADRQSLQDANARLTVYKDMVNNAHSIVGSNMNATTGAMENMTNNFNSMEERATEIEGADFADVAVKMTQAQTVLDATLKVAAQDRRSLFDYL